MIEFAIYTHELIREDGTIKMCNLIVVRDGNKIKHFTNYHLYLKTGKIVSDSSDNITRCRCVVKFLNYAFNYGHITTLNELNNDIIKEYIQLYGSCELPYDDEETSRTKETVYKCVGYIMDFVSQVKRKQKNNSRIVIDDLYRMEKKRDKFGRIIEYRVYDFDITYRDKNYPIFRDIPNKVFTILFDIIFSNHPELLGLVILGAFAGSRPAEACNCRRTDSPLGPGILFEQQNGKITKVTIDYRMEFNLRSDAVCVGRIKKARMQDVPPLFLGAFVDSYNYYMDYLSDKKYEADYGPFSLNKQGKAITYASYYGKFQNIVKNELVPILLADEDPEVVIYGQILTEHNLSPHAFRHWYTVQLVLSGVNDVGVLMHLRGDSNPESSLWYLKNKSDLVKKYQKVNNETFNYLLWASNEKYGKNADRS